MKQYSLNFADDSEIADNIRFLEKIENSWTPNQRSLNDRFRVVDIYASSQRRSRAGKYDDAVARLYRCLEMSASICLLQCEIDDVKKPNLKFFMEILGGEQELMDAFRERSGYSFPKGRPLGLKDQMILLAVSNQRLHTQIAGIYQGMEQKELLEKRNRSILAHGTVPISQSEYRDFDHSTRKIVSHVIGKRGEFEKLLQRATHPTIAIEL